MTMTQLNFAAWLCALSVVIAPFLLMREIQRHQWWNVFDVATSTIALVLVGLYVWPVASGHYASTTSLLLAALFFFLSRGVSILKHLVKPKKQEQTKPSLVAFDSGEGIWPPPPAPPAV